jgi:TATA-box binding protein (TBP) (component of TFIID and TFIIIB)
MNPIWALFFKDRIRTPFSVYKMSLAEVVVLAAIIFGAGYGVILGVKAIATWSQTFGDVNTTVEADQ